MPAGLAQTPVVRQRLHRSICRRRRSPWPVRDLTAAAEALRLANDVQPVPLNYLFLGDLHHRAGRPGKAAAAWRRVATVESDPATLYVEKAVRKLALRRLALVGTEPLSD